MAEYTIHFDGSCWPNPGGSAAYGYTIDGPDGQEITSRAGVTGTGPWTSNNVAEFDALSKGLSAALDSGLLRKGDVVQVRGDSNLVVQIMNDVWTAKPDKLYYPFWKQAFLALAKLDQIGVECKFTWIPRADNQRCDDLSKEHNHAPL